MSRETLRCCFNLIDTLHSFHRDNHRFLIDACYNVECSPNFNTQHLLSSFWRVLLKGRRGGGETDQLFTIFFYKFPITTKKKPGCDDIDWRGLFRTHHHDTIFPLPCFFFQIKSNAIIKSITQLSFTIWEWGRKGGGKMVCSVFFEISLSVNVVF